MIRYNQLRPRPLRFRVTKTLPYLWEVHDAVQMQTEFVLFGEYGLQFVRFWITDEMLAEPAARREALRVMAKRADREGFAHRLRVPEVFPGFIRAS